MQITTVFNSIEEMVEFSQLIAGNKEESAELNPLPVAPQQTAPAQPVSYGQQIAPHFPAANTSQAPVQIVTQAAPVQTQVPTQTTPVQVVQPAVQTTAPTYTPDDLANAAMQLMDKGMQAQLLELLAGYGVEAIPSLPVEQYGNFATALRGMGAQI